MTAGRVTFQGTDGVDMFFLLAGIERVGWLKSWFVRLQEGEVAKTLGPCVRHRS